MSNGAMGQQLSVKARKEVRDALDKAGPAGLSLAKLHAAVKEKLNISKEFLAVILLGLKSNNIVCQNGDNYTLCGSGARAGAVAASVSHAPAAAAGPEASEKFSHMDAILDLLGGIGDEKIELTELEERARKKFSAGKTAFDQTSFQAQLFQLLALRFISTHPSKGRILITVNKSGRKLKASPAGI